MNESYGETAFKGNFEIITLIYPKIAVALNESWVTETAIYSDQIQAKLKTNYRFAGINDEFFKLEGESEMISDEKIRIIEGEWFREHQYICVQELRLDPISKSGSNHSNRKQRRCKLFLHKNKNNVFGSVNER